MGVIAIGMSIFMFILYLPGMPAGLTLQEWIIFGIWVLLGLVFGLFAKNKFGKDFGEQEGLLYPEKVKRLLAEREARIKNAE